ncbi:RNA-directed DNA polymerase, eukaryota, reverse transcriptase zinc-binding domain protein, partial [Tanacetum coccineum]
ELLKGYNRKDGPKRVALKIDLQKAYDTVNWVFLEDILKGFGFHEKMVAWIMKCETTTSFSIIVNGESKGYFKGGRSLRQGDPISPCLFTLIMEVLNLLLIRKIGRCNSFQYHFGCSKLKITHVCFADDLLMFSHGDKQSVELLKNVIEEFGRVSGLLPNYNKSTIIFGSVKEEDRKEILEIMPFKVEKLPVRYLGVPLITKRIGVKECKSLTDKVRSKILNWKNKCLSYAGRLQLVASVLESIHVYWATVFLLPQAIIDEINSLLKGFLWNQDEKANGKAKVAWKNLCKPKCQGGLGLKNLNIWNKALISKHLWHVAMEKDSLWVKWINTYKLKGKSIWEVNEDVNDSWGWRNILRMRHLVRKHMFKKIGDGAKTSMWFDYWSDMGILSEFVTYRDIYDARMSADMTVQEFVHVNNCQWPEEWRNRLPNVNLVRSISIQDGKDDSLVWRRHDGKECKFSVKQVYYDLQHHDESVSWSKLIWFSQNIPKHAFITWLAILGRLTTQDKVRKWGSYDVMACSLCLKEMDSHSHLFFKCEYSCCLWRMVKDKIKLKCDEMDWPLIVNKYASMPNGNSIVSIERRLCIAACVYFIWQERNQRIFKNEKRKVDDLYNTLCDSIKLRLHSIKAKRSKEGCLARNGNMCCLLKNDNHGSLILQTITEVGPNNLEFLLGSVPYGTFNYFRMALGGSVVVKMGHNGPTWFECTIRKVAASVKGKWFGWVVHDERNRELVKDDASWSSQCTTKEVRLDLT